MRRVVLIALALAAAGAAALFVAACGGDGDDGRYEVRAIFDDASFVVPGLEVRVAGVRVGTVKSASVTPEKKAAVVLQIDKPAFQDFREDAFCKIQPQSLIGEQYINCEPTQQRADTEQKPPALKKIRSGPGKGQRLLPVENTSISVALDLVLDANQLPVRQRLTLIVNELGLATAGRGEDLNAIVRRSAPALRELNKVLKQLASQNQALQQIAVDTDTLMQPLVERRRNISGTIRQGERVTSTIADRRAALTASLQRAPTFLREVTPTMQRISALSDELLPVAVDLRENAPAINRVISQLTPTAEAARPAIQSLGDAAEPGIPAIRASIPITRDLNRFAQRLAPVSKTLSAVTRSLDRNDTIANFMDFFYYQALAVNGFDNVSHFLRAGLVINTCSAYATRPAIGCASKFSGQSGAPEGSANSAAAGDQTLARTRAVLNGADPEDVLAGRLDTPAPPAPTGPQPTRGAAETAGKKQAAKKREDPKSSSSSSSEKSQAEDGMMDYLFGEGTE